jgi:DNA-binding NtrC family response regulator
VLRNAPVVHSSPSVSKLGTGSVFSIYLSIAPTTGAAEDMSMPSMPGVEVRRRLKALSPTLRVAYFSGYAPEPRQDADGVVPKPISTDELLRRVREILDRPTPR